MINSPPRAIARFNYIPDLTSNYGMWTLNTLPLPASDAAEITQVPLKDGTEPPTPSICVVNGERDGSTQKLFLQPPTFYEDEVRARIWARQNGYAGVMAPAVSCPLSVLRTSDQ